MQPQTETHMPQTLRVESSAFGMNESIPTQFTGDSDDIAPPLSWSAVPAGAKSIAVIVEDPDAPNPDAPERTFTHWIVTDIPPTTTSLRGGNSLPDGAVMGTNDWGKRAWRGPNPPIGRHRYFFKVYALDTMLKLDESARKNQLEKAMSGHILAQGELVGLYDRKRK